MPVHHRAQVLFTFTPKPINNLESQVNPNMHAFWMLECWRMLKNVGGMLEKTWVPRKKHKDRESMQIPYTRPLIPLALLHYSPVHCGTQVFVHLQMIRHSAPICQASHIECYEWRIFKLKSDELKIYLKFVSFFSFYQIINEILIKSNIEWNEKCLFMPIIETHIGFTGQNIM